MSKRYISLSGTRRFRFHVPSQRREHEAGERGSVVRQVVLHVIRVATRGRQTHRQV